MYSDLIIGFDDSLPAHDALAFARRLALATGARPMVLYVSPFPDSAAETVRLEPARRAMADVPGAMFEAVADRSAARVLHRVAADAEAALIVLGATHRTGRRRVVPGTTADAVIHAAPCAVAIAPAGYADTDHAAAFGRVTAAVDGGEETERVARVAARIARRAGGSLRLVTVAEVPYSQGPEFAGNLGYRSMRDAIRETATRTLERAVAAAGDGIEIDQRVAAGNEDDADVPRAIARESEDVDLLVIGSRGYGPLRRVVVGSSTAGILRAATCPVLVVPRRTAEELDDAVVPFGAATVELAPEQPPSSPSTA